ncbi:hypothetical protein HA402_004111 [Bradysia odoriphaga]|nr:hypothetical protein HA402_004111 [Bradysia odoriphaga]
MSDVWAGIAGEFLHLYPRGGRLLAVAGADAERSRRAADDLGAALTDAGQTVERAHSADGDEQALRAEVIAPFRADAAADRVVIVSGPAELLGAGPRMLWNYALWQLAGDEPPHTVANAIVDVTDPAAPTRRFADYCAAPAAWGARRLRREVLEHELAHLRRVGDRDVQQEVVVAAEEEHLDHRRQHPHPVGELDDALPPSARAQRDADDRLETGAQHPLVDARVEPGDHSTIQQRAQPGMRGRGGDAELGGEFRVGHPSVGGQQPHDRGVGLIESGGTQSVRIRRRLRGLHPNDYSRSQHSPNSLRDFFPASDGSAILAAPHIPGGSMKIGVPTEVKNNENRVSLTPAGVDRLTHEGHRVLVQSGAGLGSRISDDAYRAAGAEIVPTAEETWAAADLLIKVKEPIAQEYGFLRDDLTLFTYLHLAADRPLTDALVDAGTTAVAYETVQLPDRSLPLLMPMSEIAGRLSVVMGSHSLMRSSGGRGMLLGGIAGTPRGKTVVIGGGVAGEHAAANALGLGSRVTVIDISLSRLRELEHLYPGLETRASSRYDIAEELETADLVIGSVLIPGAAAPKLVTDEMVAAMKPGSVLVDIAIDQGGCFEGSRPTTHDDPTFAVHDSIYYCVANMPGAVPETSTRALTNATLPYVSAIAAKGWTRAAAEDPALAKGLNVQGGLITLDAVAQAHGLAA